MRRCLSCQEPIHPKAKLCKTCKSYQDWRRYFSFSAVVLSLLVALISVISAVGPRMISWLPPLGSRLEVKSYYYSPDAITLIVENKGNRAGYIGRVNVVLYCNGAFFHDNDLDKYEHDINSSTQAPVFGVNIDLGTSPNTSRTIPARSIREISFILSRDRLLKAEEDFEKRGRYALGNFSTVLYNESVRIIITAELWNYGQKSPNPVPVSETPDPPFWRGFTTITEKM